ncbi:hypothetical protein D9M69_314130 [compost metagenome]
MADQLVGGGPGGINGLAHYHVQAHAETYRAAVPGGAATHVGDLLGHGGRRLAPGQVSVHVLGRQFVGGRRGTAEVQRRIGLLYRREEVLRAFDLEVLALEADGLALQQAAPDSEEFVGRLVALVMREEHAIGGQLRGIAAGHDVEQQTAVAGLVQAGGLACRGSGVAERGAQCHQQLDALGHRHQAGCGHPGVQAAGAGGNQQAVVAELVGGYGDLAHVGVGRRAAAGRVAQVAGVAGSRQEPEDIQTHDVFLVAIVG